MVLWVALKRAVVVVSVVLGDRLTSETVQGASLAFQGVHHIHSGDGLSLGVLGVGDGVPDHVLQEHFQHTAGLLVDQTGDTLDATTTRKTADSGLGNALDVIAKNFAMTLGAPFPEPFASLSSAAHPDASVPCRREENE